MRDLAEVFAKEMRRRRDASGLAQEALGVMLGLDRNSVSRVERGAPNIPIERAAAIAEALGTSLAEMLGGDGPGKTASEMRDAFAGRVRALRLGLDLNQRELAKKMKVDRNWVSAVESGKQNVRLRTLQTFARALRVKPEDLL
ncbi:helix-turn-helix transcriptional regulator [Paraburkholderia podalyriae]|uniref:Helix-turn-helix domain-containing protein n=2 Tax=Paraburkholderia podalyriae TaxID=1938811 RepID=A0ABR7PZ46_9BURK|nr:helix-turn-helix domain-containing protein [Paraburkholderia podalyriae]